MGPERAVFSIIERAAPPEDCDQVYFFCLAASITASAAIASGKCPEPIESAVASAFANNRAPSFKKGHSDVSGAAGDGIMSETEGKVEGESILSKLQYCVHETKVNFLQRLCHNIMQVSCVANDPAQLLVELDPVIVMGVNMDDFFKSVSNGTFKSKKYVSRLIFFGALISFVLLACRIPID